MNADVQTVLLVIGALLAYAGLVWDMNREIEPRRARRARR